MADLGRMAEEAGDTDQRRGMEKGERCLVAAKERTTVGSDDPGGGPARQDPRVRVKGAMCFFSGRRCHVARQAPSLLRED
ncbi:hypothetical protein ZWY2020_020715 [Hordeum vulgare]|nr:hypothetical protein ZWY2020_020715 [Hordeum vulgare]